MIQFMCSTLKFWTTPISIFDPGQIMDLRQILDLHQILVSRQKFIDSRQIFINPHDRIDPLTHLATTLA